MPKPGKWDPVLPPSIPPPPDEKDLSEIDWDSESKRLAKAWKKRREEMKRLRQESIAKARGFRKVEGGPGRPGPGRDYEKEKEARAKRRAQKSSGKFFRRPDLKGKSGPRGDRPPLYKKTQEPDASPNT